MNGHSLLHWASRIAFFRGCETTKYADEKVLESDLMEEEVVFWKVKMPKAHLLFVKGTSDKNERVRILDRVIELVP